MRTINTSTTSGRQNNQVVQLLYHSTKPKQYSMIMFCSCKPQPGIHKANTHRPNTKWYTPQN